MNHAGSVPSGILQGFFRVVEEGILQLPLRGCHAGEISQL
jgi:hypothetical protein